MGLFVNEVSKMNCIYTQSVKRYLDIGTSENNSYINKIPFSFIQNSMKVIGLSECAMLDLVQEMIGNNLTDMILTDNNFSDDMEYIESQFYEHFLQMSLDDCYFMCDCYKFYSQISKEAEAFISKYIDLDLKCKDTVAEEINSKKVKGQELAETIKDTYYLLDIRLLIELKMKIRTSNKLKDDNVAIKEQLFKNLSQNCPNYEHLFFVLYTYPELTDKDLLVWLTYLLLNPSQQIKIMKIIDELDKEYHKKNYQNLQNYLRFVINTLSDNN